MGIRRFDMFLAAALIGLVPAGEAAAQAQPAVRVTGAELESWFASDQMAVAGIGLNNCHWITKGPGSSRSQTVHCPGSAPFTVTGQAQVQADRLCSKFVYPDGTRFEACQEVFKVGDNKYEGRDDGVLRNVFYRLIR